jgi:hypothetical protein
MDQISVEVQGASIIVTKPGTDFTLIYEKHPAAPVLVLTHSWVSPTTTSQSSVLEPFRPPCQSERARLDRVGVGFGRAPSALCALKEGPARG